MKNKAEWEQMGAASGLLATTAFVGAFVAFLSTNPTGNPPYPSVQNAQAAPAYVAANLNSFRMSLLLTSLGLVLFLWFLSSLWVALRGAEGDQGRGATAMVIGATAGTGLMLTSLVLGFAEGLATSPSQAAVVPTLHTTGSLLFAIGGATMSLFFFGAARVVGRTDALPKWLGVLAFIFACLCVLAFISSVSEAGLFDPATGLLGRWLWYGAFVVWVFLASLTMTMKERQLLKAAKAGAHTADTTADAEGAN